MALSGEVEYLNCRAVNQRRVDIRGAYALRVRVPFVHPQQILTKLEGGEIRRKTETLSLMKNAACLDKLITAEEEIEFPAPPLAVLDISGLGQTEEIKLISGKAVVKGRVEVQVLYRTQPGISAGAAGKGFPLPSDPGPGRPARKLPLFCLGGAGGQHPHGGQRLGEQRRGDRDGHAPSAGLLPGRGAEAVSDAYSTRYETQLEEQTVQSEELADTLNQNVDCQVRGALPDENAEVLECFAVPSAP